MLTKPIQTERMKYRIIHVNFARSACSVLAVAQNMCIWQLVLDFYDPANTMSSAISLPNLRLLGRLSPLSE